MMCLNQIIENINQTQTAPFAAETQSAHTTKYVSIGFINCEAGNNKTRYFYGMQGIRSGTQYTHPNFQRPHFQFDAVWLIDHVKL